MQIGSYGFTHDSNCPHTIYDLYNDVFRHYLNLDCASIEELVIVKLPTN